MKKIVRSKRFLILTILVALIGLFMIYLQVDQLTPSDKVKYDNIEYVKEEFIDASELEMNNQVIIGENHNYQLLFDEKTTYFAIKDKKSGVIWYSNPQGGNLKSKHQATLVVDYSTNKGISNSSRNNYDYSINHSSGDKTYKVRYLENAVQVLYVIENAGIDIRYFPQKISIDRMESMILSNPELSKKQLKQMEDYYDKKVEEGYYEIDLDGETITVINNMYEIFYTICGYTREDLEFDNTQYEVVVSFDEPYFEIAVEYRLTEDGLMTSIISDSIVEKEDFPITSISLLPYFGAANNTEEGYFVFPDGSGVIMRFNNGKSYNAPYSNVYYGDDLAVLPEAKPETKENLLLPIYGIVNSTKDSAMLGIIKKGASMTSLSADVSGRANEVYNRVSTSVDLRKMEGTLFVNRGLKYTVPTWTKSRLPSDIVFEYQFLSGEDANYNGLAKQYQQYLVDNQGLYKKDQTTKTVLNVNMLGMFEKQEFILGVPYNKTESLTTFEEAIKILDELQTKKIENINVIYDGWFNNSMDHTIASDIKVNGAVGGNKGLDKLIQYTDEHQIKLYPTMNLMYSAGYEKPFDPIRYTAEHINGKMSMLNEYNLATKLRMKMLENNYVLSPELYNSLTTKMLQEYRRYSFSGIGLNDIGSNIAGDYPKNDYTFRSDAVEYQLDVLDQVDNKYDVMMYAPFGFSATFADTILEVPVTNTKLPILDETIPFYQLVFNGYIDYSSISINENSELGTNYHKLKAIETGSNVNYVFSYKDSSVLLTTDFNNFYSTNYRNWIDSAVEVVQELDQLEIHKSTIDSHEIIDKGVYKVSYKNGNSFIINYNAIPYTYAGIVIDSENYVIVGGDHNGNH